MAALTRRQAAALLGSMPFMARAADAWPSRPVRIIVPYVTGGGADILTRYMAQQLTQALHQPFIADNRAGAGGVTGVENGLGQPADGYTLTLISSSYTVNPSLYKLRFDPVADIVPLVQLSRGPLVVVVPASSPVKSMKDLAALAGARPGELNYASSGQGSILHLAAAQWARRAGVDMRHIPYKGGGAALNDLMGGQIDVYFAATASALPLIQSGKLRALAVTTAERMPALPQLPTIAEAGWPGYDVTLWYGLIAQKGVPQDVVARANAECNKVLALPATPVRFETDGALPAGGTAAAFGERIRREIAIWREAVPALGVKPE